MKILKTIAAIVLIAPALALAAGSNVKLDRAPVDPYDLASMQRGAQAFVNYCLNCHSANYMRFNRLRDLGLTDEQIRDNLVLTEAKVGDLMKVAMDKKDAKTWFGVAPPDLTVTARARSSPAGSGTDWIYTYLRSFYRDGAQPNGWNNLVYPNVSMPHVLWELQGEQVMKDTKVRAEGYMKTVQQLALDKPGKLSPVEYDRLAADLANYMTYMSEPARNDRIRYGIYVLIALLGLTVLSFALKKDYWKDVS